MFAIAWCFQLHAERLLRLRIIVRRTCLELESWSMNGQFVFFSFHSTCRLQWVRYFISARNKSACCTTLRCLLQVLSLPRTSLEVELLTSVSSFGNQSVCQPGSWSNQTFCLIMIHFEFMIHPRCFSWAKFHWNGEFFLSENVRRGSPFGIFQNQKTCMYLCSLLMMEIWNRFDLSSLPAALNCRWPDEWHHSGFLSE